MKKHGNTVFGYKKGQKQNLKINIIFRPQVVKLNILSFCEKPHSFRYFLNFELFWIFLNCGLFWDFGKDLSIKLWQNTTIQFLVTKRGQKQNLKIKTIFCDPKLHIERFCTFVKSLKIFDIFWILGFLGVLVRICA